MHRTIIVLYRAVLVAVGVVGVVGVLLADFAHQPVPAGSFAMLGLASNALLAEAASFALAGVLARRLPGRYRLTFAALTASTVASAALLLLLGWHGLGAGMAAGALLGATPAIIASWPRPQRPSADPVDAATVNAAEGAL